uniref:ATP synthase F0 subunit 8 n=1 Tax=Manayunkia occidentalis TaxID=2704156 RepID=UPI00165FAF8B|nr:ATP synthase F0 subunit 8 [Manayunkia occidentalis]QLM00894.1 ATP synthase F0 subunit 8 [Manayunkia occidentalis]
MPQFAPIFLLGFFFLFWISFMIFSTTLWWVSPPKFDLPKVASSSPYLISWNWS